MKQKSLLDFQDHWQYLVNKASADYNSLTQDERVWLNGQSLLDQVDNGGLISHYYNSGADYNQETIEDLQWLGFSKLVGLLIRINRLFPSGQPSKDILERNEVIDAWPAGQHEPLLADLDHQFDQATSALESALVQHIETKLSLMETLPGREPTVAAGERINVIASQ
jgi:hypothetical protein